MTITYIVKSGDTIYDVAYNTTGSLSAVDAIMDANGIVDYSATLLAGTVLTFEAEIQLIHRNQKYRYHIAWQLSC